MIQTHIVSPWRHDFECFSNNHSKQVPAYLDSAATSQMSTTVIHQLTQFDQYCRANVNRGVYPLSAKATQAYAHARQTVADFIHAKPEQVVFTHGCTEALNIVCASYLAPIVTPGDEIILTTMEHHANIVPWQVLAQQKKLKLNIVSLHDDGSLNLDQLYQFLARPRCKLLSLTHISNVLGTINPIQAICKQAHQHGVPVCVDGAQSGQHMPLDMQALGADFYVLSGHKMGAPFGIGVLYARDSILANMVPFQTGGGMIESVDFNHVTFAHGPERFEAGTPNISGAVGLGYAIDYLNSIGLDTIQAYEQMLGDYMQQSLHACQGLHIQGTAPHKAAIVSFTLDDVHAHDVATIMGEMGVCVRAGHHCAMPLMKSLGIHATIRASASFYNDSTDVDRLVEAVSRCKRLFQA
ncbi:MAG: cysteine desulfurase [Pseudomonadota bacterium]|nr:cysteine desulfurase [Pseudomonadota bacterium]